MAASVLLVSNTFEKNEEVLWAGSYSIHIKIDFLSHSIKSLWCCKWGLNEHGKIVNAIKQENSCCLSENDRCDSHCDRCDIHFLNSHQIKLQDL